MTDFETQLSELLLLLTPDQLEAARDLLLLLTGGAQEASHSQQKEAQA